MPDMGELSEFLHPFGVAIKDGFRVRDQAGCQGINHFFRPVSHSHSRPEACLTHPPGGDMIVAYVLIRRVQIRRPQIGIDLLTRASDASADLGVRIRYRHYPGTQQES